MLKNVIRIKKNSEPDHVIIRKTKLVLYAIILSMIFCTFFALLSVYWSVYINVEWNQTSILGQFLGGAFGIIIILTQLALRGFLIGLLIHYYYALVIITPERIIHLKYELINKESATVAELYRILSIKSSQNGMLATLFNYGNVVLQLQNDANISLKRLPRPKKIVSMISKRKEYVAEQRLHFVSEDGTVT